MWDFPMSELDMGAAGVCLDAGNCICFAGGVSMFDMCDIPGVEPAPGIVSPGSAPGAARSSTPRTPKAAVVP